MNLILGEQILDHSLSMRHHFFLPYPLFLHCFISIVWKNCQAPLTTPSHQRFCNTQRFFFVILELNLSCCEQFTDKKKTHSLNLSVMYQLRTRKRTLMAQISTVYAGYNWDEGVGHVCRMQMRCMHYHDADYPWLGLLLQVLFQILNWSFQFKEVIFLVHREIIANEASYVICTKNWCSS